MGAKAFFAASLCVGVVLAATKAGAASLERLGDGRVIVMAFGERLAFREKDAERVDFFWNYHCDPKDNLGATLADWLNDPQVAECLNRTIPDGVPDDHRNLTFLVTLVVDEGLVYPGGIDARDIAKTSLFRRRLYVSLKDTSIKGDCNFPAPGISGKLGYDLDPLSVSPKWDEYTLKASSRIGDASRPLCVACTTIGTESCSVHLSSSDRTVGVGLGWEQWELIGPQAPWATYDAAARKIAQSIFIDRPARDFQ